MLEELKKVIDKKNLEYVELEDSIQVNIYNADFSSRMITEKLINKVINENKPVKIEKDSTGVLHIEIKD